MCECAKAAAERKIACLKFSLQDCRPESLSDKLEARYTDSQDATLRIDSEMSQIDEIYWGLDTLTDIFRERCTIYRSASYSVSGATDSAADRWQVDPAR
ncbi:hypothetical protein ASD34_00055 [Variovorax sp. Root473]|nr:hypothetical protein ASD34_00055 [Variovorax sp. Root473]